MLHFLRMRKTVVGIIVLVSITPFNIFSASIFHADSVSREATSASSSVATPTPSKKTVPESGSLRPVHPTRRATPNARPARPGRHRNPSAALVNRTDSMLVQEPADGVTAIVEENFSLTDGGDSVIFTSPDTIPVVESDLFNEGVVTTGQHNQGKKVFVPDATRAVWLSALCPGLGQIYNRRYWKLPIVIGGFMGLGYGASWNNSMLTDYTRAYYDLMDNDPSTKSYMDFFPPNTKEESLNRSWLERTLKRKKDYFRRNRDLCIIGMVGVYLVAIVDAYVDASLTNFDITPDLTVDVFPAMIADPLSPYPALGVQWAFTF